jgi:SAM-dependent methyltransferase
MAATFRDFSRCTAAMRHPSPHSMTAPSDYLEINRKSWNARTAVHMASKFYDLAGFRSGACSLNEIELGLLGDVTGKRILHLQCHFGQDTLSLARMGATVTGVDLSDVAIDEARKLAAELDLAADFVCCDVYSLTGHLDGQFDIVYASYGAIGWLPDLSRWAQIARHFLRHGGKLVLVEFHPVVWMFDERFQGIQYSYFNTGPIHESSSGTYADTSAPIQVESVGWNHALSEVLGSLLAQGMTIRHFAEYDYSPYACFETVVKVAERKYRIPTLAEKIPLLYSVVAE